MSIGEISEYPGFSIKNNKLHYKERIKSKVQNSTKEEFTNKAYTLDHIPYQTIVCEAALFYINNYFQGSIINFNAVGLKILSYSIIWKSIFNYLLWTPFSSSMKNMLKDGNYRKNYEKEILTTFENEFKLIKDLRNKV